MSSKTVAGFFGVGIPNIIVPVPEMERHPIPSRIKEAIRYLPFGIEIECERVPQIMNTQLWMTKEDGSLRNDGQEFVSRYGTTVGHFNQLFDELEEHVKKWRTKLKTAGYFEFTERTSVHIHLDLSRFTEEMLENLLVLYTLYEEPLFAICAPNRKHNVFTIPLRASVVMDIVNKPPNSIWSVVNKFVKYSALNLACLKKFGTVEFRHHEGTMDRKKLNDWVMILSLLRYYAERVSNEQLRERIYKLKSHSAYEMLADDVFHGYSPIIMRNTDPQVMDLAVSDAKCFFIGEQ